MKKMLSRTIGRREKTPTGTKLSKTKKTSIGNNSEWWKTTTWTKREKGEKSTGNNVE
jgi:hypothetical protein